MWKVRFGPSSCYVLAGSQEISSSERAILLLKEPKMSKKNRNRWHNSKPAAQPSTAHAEPEASAPFVSQPQAPAIGIISPAQLAANRANALLSTGPRTAT